MWLIYVLSYIYCKWLGSFWCSRTNKRWAVVINKSKQKETNKVDDIVKWLDQATIWEPWVAVGWFDPQSPEWSRCVVVAKALSDLTPPLPRCQVVDTVWDIAPCPIILFQQEIYLCWFSFIFILFHKFIIMITYIYLW